MIQLDDKQCLIVGGGAVAARKAAQMCEFGACVTVVAPEICAELLAIADTERIDETAGIVENIDGNCQKKPERIRVWKREVTEADISGMDVVIMATDDAELNSQYAELCRSKHILVNVVDVKKDCDFYFPAIIKQGEVVVSVSTGGNSPMLASKIKKDIRQTLRTDYGQIADELGAIREKILAEEPDERARKRRFAAIVEAKMQEQRIRIGTRGSRLAQIQTDMVIEQLKKHYPDVQFEKVIVTTKGDKQKEAAISSFGGKAVFVEEIEEALLDGTIDLAVHSAKDMPNPCKKGLVIAGVLPEGKESVIRRLQAQGKVAMVGDGINDAPALTRADIGVAIGAGTDVAIDAADVVLMKSRLSDVPAAIRLSRATLRNIHENLFWAFFYNVIGIPLAAGVWIPLFGWTLNPMFGAAAMSLSSFCVVSNALRLNLFKLHDAGKDKKINRHSKHKEETTMVKTMKIEGMMCGHCEAAVKKALEAIDGVASAEVSHTAGTAVVTLSKPVENAVLRKAVEDKDYTVTDIEG